MILVGKYEGKKILGRCRRRWVANSKMGPEEIGWEGLIVVRMRTSGGLL